MNPVWQRYVTRCVRWGYDRVAPFYDRLIRITELLVVGDGRAWIGRHAAGDTLEVAIGTGRNLPSYRRELHLVGIDLSKAMLARASRRTRVLGRPVALVVGDAQALPFPAASFDTVVCTLALPAVANARAALAEMHRVLRPHGRLLYLDHVRSSGQSLRAAGFTIGLARRSRLGIVVRGIAQKETDTPS